jgi:hypothetical protein
MCHSLEEGRKFPYLFVCDIFVGNGDETLCRPTHITYPRKWRSRKKPFSLKMVHYWYVVLLIKNSSTAYYILRTMIYLMARVGNNWWNNLDIGLQILLQGTFPDPRMPVFIGDKFLCYVYTLMIELL